jgi:uncharacterized coiled-coil protein SlyX
MTEISNQKVVNRSVAIALGVICIVLAASLVVAVANGSLSSDQQSITDLEEQVAEQTTKISSLNAQVTILQNQVNTLNSSISDYETQIADLTQENNDYANIIALNMSATILDEEAITQDANATTTLLNDTLYYAGYIEIHVESSSNSTYVQVSYTYEGLSYNQTVTVGTDGTAYFPILPAAVEILLDNTGAETNNVTATITYYY